MKIFRIGILTGGGDCAGINPAIKWVVKTALDRRLDLERDNRYEVIGIRNGWHGLVDVNPDSSNVDQHIVPLDEKKVRTWDRYGGTNLGTSRTNPYDANNDCSKQVLSNIKKLGIEALVVIGGEDTLGVAQKLSHEGVNVVGIPKTIDKDLSATDYTLGFETALEFIIEAVDRLRTTAGSHERIFVVETMGRHSGWLALDGGESCGAFLILIPEYDFSVEKVNELLLEGRKSGARYEIIIVAEGAKPIDGTEIVMHEEVDSFGHKTLGGVGEFLAEEIRKVTGIETRNIALSYLQRSGTPCAYDRRMGRYFGIAAVDLIINRDFGKMVALKKGEVIAVPLEDALRSLNQVNVERQYDIERYNGRRNIIRK